MDLAKAILLAKLAAYGIDDNLILYIHSYLSNRKQWVCINNILSEFNKVIVGVPQGSIVGPILFDCFFSIFYYFIKNVNVHNPVNDNTFVNHVGSKCSNLKGILRRNISYFLKKPI